MTSPNLPQCFACKYGGQEFPCRTADGRFDFEKVARAIVERGRSIAEAYRARAGAELVDHDIEYPNDWAVDCEFDLLHDHPDLVLPLIVAEMDACETGDDAAYIAAGFIESAMVKHGPQLIDRVEAIARRSAKFRYILSGIWSQGGSMDADVWARIAKALDTSQHMDDDARTPAAGSDGEILDEADVRKLMGERVADVASAIVT
ncbi:MAG: hypothetical protein NW216_03460 [Hyphomicrobium sp.]|nr:hypothetical protein [Hyphomicrobium sp.]